MKRELEADTVTLFTDAGEIECGIVMVFERNEREYVAVSPLDEEGEFSDEIWLYRFGRDVTGGDDHDIVYIEEEEEYEQAIEEFEMLVQECS